MSLNALLRALIIIIVIIGGTIMIIIWRIPIPDPPPCIVCGRVPLNLLGWAEVILGVASYIVANKTFNNNRKLS